MRTLLILPLTALTLASAVAASPLLAQRTPVRSPALILSEFGASNGGLLFDEDGESSDWIELHNRRKAPFEAGGWTLTDEQGDAAKWRIPDGTLIPARGYLLIFASGKDRSLPGAQLHTNFKLSAQGEYLALVRPDGTPTTAYAPAFPIQYSDASFGLAFDPRPTDEWSYFATPTPGAANPLGGPLVFDLTHSPAQPTHLEKILVTALVPGDLAGGTVELLWRINFHAEKLRIMRDDGQAPDVTAGDGIYSTKIPSGATDPGEMVRWRVRATHGVSGGSTTLPLFADPLGSPEYMGTVIADPSLQSALPIWDWHVQFPKKAGTIQGTRTSVYYAGEFYDNVHVRNRGTKWPKRHYKFDFNKDHRLRFTQSGPRRDEANLNSTWTDKAFVRQVLSFDLYRLAGVRGCDVFPVRMQRGGKFFSVAVFVEEPGEEGFLEYHGLDPAGALYKMFNTAISWTIGVEKKTRLHEDHADLEQLILGIKKTDDELRRFLFDHVDVAACISYVAATTLTHDNDHIAKNYYLYRDSDGDGEWRFLPWDKDLTLGRNFTPVGGVLNDTLWSDLDPFSHPLFGDDQHPKVDGPHNRLIHALHAVPEIRQMYLRRLRTLMDAYLQPPGTPRSQRWFERRMDQLAIQMDPDVILDQAKWGIPNWGTSYDFHADLDRLEMLYVQVRRAHLYVTHGPPNGSIPGPQANPAVRFGVLEGDPASGDQDEEYIQLLNPETVAADLSGWTITGGVQWIFAPGTVLAAGAALYASPDLPTFRARAQSPTGNEGRFVVGPIDGHLKSGEWVRLFDAAGQLVDERQY